jgi:protein-tyrosine-phosphatase
MNGAWSDLDRRAAVHSALGDPGRLAIVDALTLGDVSPSALQEALGMASNLLAHHVKVLERAGVVRRVRSEGDRRRSYLSVVPDALTGLNPAAAVEAARVVFVCTENAARSQLAAAMWTDRSTVPAASAGTHPAVRVHPGTIAAARRHHVTLRSPVPRALDDVIRGGDVVITVCDRAHEELPTEMRRSHWSIPDPAARGIDRDTVERAFDRAVDELTDRIARFAPAVTRIRSA